MEFMNLADAVYIFNCSTPAVQTNIETWSAAAKLMGTPIKKNT